MLRKAAKALYQVKVVGDTTVILICVQNDKFTEEEMHNYRMAVTEREVAETIKARFYDFMIR